MKREHLTDGAVVILNAGRDAGCDLAARVLTSGRAVMLVDRDAARMVRAMHGYRSDQVAAVAADVADPRQLEAVLQRARARFGRVDSVIDVSSMSSVIDMDAAAHGGSHGVPTAFLRKAS
jgi:NADP-dependent 3-hydroxy acid dehydrogenase YdfG